LTDGKVYRADSALVPARQISESERSGQAQSPQLEAAASRRIVTQEVPSKTAYLPEVAVDKGRGAILTIVEHKSST
jgi:hypothetical protein